MRRLIVSNKLIIILLDSKLINYIFDSRRIYGHIH